MNSTIQRNFRIFFVLEKALAFPKLTTSVAIISKIYMFIISVAMILIKYKPHVRLDRRISWIFMLNKISIKIYTKNFENIITYSDSCTRQNKNIKTVLSLLKLLQSIEIRIESIEMHWIKLEKSKPPYNSIMALTKI